MRRLIFILLVLSSSSVYADLINEELIAKKGISCLKDQYSIFDTKNLKNISDTVNCVEEVKITDNNEIQNLDCPEQPIFNSFLNSQSKYQRKSTCLRKDRNQSPDIYENINCACVTESLKNDYGEDFSKKNSQFKKELKEKIQKNIGERFKKKIETIKNNEILLTESGGTVRSCFDRSFFKEKFLRLANLKGCSSNTEKAIERIENIFGDALGIDVNKDSIDETLDNLLNGIKQEASLGNAISTGKNSCFRDSKDMERKYIRMKYDDKAVNLKASFGSFIKGRDLNSPTIRQEFNQFVKDQGMDLHPLIKTLTRNNLPAFLKEIDNDRSGKELTLNKLLTGTNQRRWMNYLAMSSRIDCVSTADEIVQTICTDAEIAYDDPIVIETFLEEDDTDFKNKNTLDLKNLYCEKKDLHSIDKKGRLLVYKNKLESNLNPEHIMNTEFQHTIKGVIKSFNDRAPLEGLKILEDKFLAKNDHNLYQNNNEQIARLEEAKRIISLSTLNYFRQKKKQNEKPNRKDIREFKTFFQGMDNIKSVLHDRQDEEIRKVANEVYDIQRPNQSKKEFEKSFVKNFIDRRYSRELTNNLDIYHPNKSEKDSELKCHSNFESTYCAIQDQFKGKADSSCIEHISSMSTIDATNKGAPKNSFQSACTIGSGEKDISLKSIIQSINEKIETLPNICKEVEENDYRRAFTEANNTSNMAGMYYEAQTGKTDDLFEVASSTSKFFDEDEIIEKVVPTPEEASITNQNINTFSKVEPVAEDKDSNNFFSKLNFFNNSSQKKTSEQLEEMSKKELEEDIKGKSTEDLQDYIAKLESMINEKQKKLSTTKEESTTINPELEKLRKELEDLKSKTEVVKDEISKVDATPKVENKTSTPQKTVQPTRSFPNVSQKQSTDSALNNDNEIINEPDQFTNNNTNQPMNNSIKSDASQISLNLNEQFEEILSKPSADGQMEVIFNDQKYIIEVKQGINGETVCAFTDEKLNNTKPEELDEICKQYIESLSKVEENKKEEVKKEVKKLDPKPKKERKTFKVEDLNKVLNN
ncbi:hypothetical protein [Halobacteriovorax sp.]|uniref:hypothetical protein n=1 Tax=Halobacteriovorax sp. TaxID=2020862 RepID=UPI00356B1E53